LNFSNFLCLVKIPLVGLILLCEYGLGVGAMPHYGDHRDQDREDADGEGDGSHAALAAFAHLLGKFFDFCGFHRPGLPLCSAAILRERGLSSLNAFPLLSTGRCLREAGLIDTVEKLRFVVGSEGIQWLRDPFCCVTLDE
jgi:hypothetical protein